MEPLVGIEPTTYALPRRRYTTKPQWQYSPPISLTLINVSSVLDDWLKDVAPSTELRKWFSHDPAKWGEFQRRYRAELEHQPQLWKPLLSAARNRTITLVFSSHDVEHNNAVVLKEFLESQLRKARKAA